MTPIARPRPSTDLATLQECWQQWTSVVECYATKRWRRAHVDQEDYHRIHSRLLHACRSLAEQADPVQRSFYESLDELARPWMEARVLGRTSDRYLADLLVLCRRAEKQLTGRERPRHGRRWLVLAALVAALATASALVAVGQIYFGWPVVDGIRNGSSAIYRAALATTLTQRLAFGGLIVAAAVIYVVARRRRS